MLSFSFYIMTYWISSKRKWISYTKGLIKQRTSCLGITDTGHPTPAGTREEPLCIVIQSNWHAGYMIQGLRYAIVFRLGLTYTHKHSPGLPSSFSDLMPPTVPAPAGSTVSAGASSHSKKIQLNLQHTNTQIHGSLLQLPARSSLTGY